MKITCYILLLFCAISGYAGTNQEKQIRKIIKKNPYLYVPADTTDSRNFWEYIRFKNEDLTHYESIGGPFKKKVIKKFQEYTSHELTFVPRKDVYFHLENIYPRLREKLCGTGEWQFSTIVITRYPSFNAASTPHGFISLTADLFDLLEYPELLGVLAHEMAHFILRHAEIHQYESMRKKRKDNIDKYLRTGTIENLFEAAHPDAQSYYFSYSCSQETEADIIAMRFLEFYGINPQFYISALEKMKVYLLKRGYNTSGSCDTDDHPSLDFRIALLTALPRANKVYFDLPEKNGPFAKAKELPDPYSF